MKNLILFLIFSLSTFLSFSQYIEGKVLDAKTSKPIEGVHVYVDKIKKGALTNKNGNYYLKFSFSKEATKTIQFSHIKYQNLVIPFNSKKKNYSVYLIEDINKLSEVEIIEKRNLKPRIQYKKLTSMKNGVHSFGSFLKNNKIYVIGGDASFEANDYLKNMDLDSDLSFSELLRKSSGYYYKENYKGDLSIYNIKSNTWEVDKDKFSDRAYHNANYNNNKIYIIGGKRVSRNGKFEYLKDEIEVFDFKSNTIKIDNTNPHQAIDFASFTYKGNIIVMGGSIKKKNNGFKEYSNKVHLYNLKTGYWFQLGSMPIAKEVSGVLIQDKIYLLGGFNKKPLFGIETFDLKTQKWEKEGNLFYGIAYPAITYNNNIIYFFDDGKISTYNVLKKELSEYLIDLSLSASKLYYTNNKLYILGGFRNNNYSTYPSRGLFSIDVDEFYKTKINRSKTL
jgi:carboxypeptidase-like protein/Kelch motif protein/kelch motif-containing protein